MKIALEYEKDQYLEFEKHSINTIVGYNQTLKWKIMRSLYRFNEGKQLNLLEENVYGDDGLSLFIDDKLIKAKQLKMLFITSFSEFNQQLEIGKNTLMQSFIADQLSDVTIQHQFEKLNNQYMLIEQRFNDILQTSGLKHTILKVNLPNLDDLVRKAVLVGQQDIPLSLMDSNQLVSSYLYLLQYYMDHHSNYVFVILRHENDFLDEKSIQILERQLRLLSVKYPQLIILSINDNGPVHINHMDTEEIIFIGDDIQQLPPFDILKQSIYFNYPLECRLSDAQLVEELNVILPYIKPDINGNRSINMVLYETIRKLLQ